MIPSYLLCRSRYILCIWGRREGNIGFWVYIGILWVPRDELNESLDRRREMGGGEVWIRWMREICWDFRRGFKILSFQIVVVLCFGNLVSTIDCYFVWHLLMLSFWFFFVIFFYFYSRYTYGIFFISSFFYNLFFLYLILLHYLLKLLYIRNRTLLFFLASSQLYNLL